MFFSEICNKIIVGTIQMLILNHNLFRNLQNLRAVENCASPEAKSTIIT